MGVAYCWDGCGRPAVRERLSGMAGADEVVELVCEVHAGGDVLACGHVDDDPCSWHTQEDGSIVCSGCCTYCNEGEGRMTVIDQKRHGVVRFTRQVGENTGWITFVACDGRKALGFVSNANSEKYDIPEWHAVLDISQGGGGLGYFDRATEALAVLTQKLGGTAYEIDG